MMVLNLTRGKSTLCVPLHLPATPADIGAAYAKLDSISMDDRKTHVVRAITGVDMLDRWLRGRKMDRPGDYIELGELSEKIDRMNDKEIKTFDGALTGAAFETVKDILHIADSLEDYIFIHGVTTEKELGRFLVDTGYKGFPAFVQPYLDYAAIGIEYHAEHDGAFTAEGYTLRRGSAEPLLAERQHPVVFTVYLRTGGMRKLGQDPFRLELPASDEQLDYAKNALNIEEFEEAAIVQIAGLEKLPLQNIPIESMDVGQLNGFADGFVIADETQDRDKLRAALELEKSATLDEAVGIILHPENYVMIQDTCEEYGRKALLKLTGDQEVVDTVDGFIDWDEFGEQMMQEDGIVQTGYGMICRVNGPSTEQTMDSIQPMQSMKTFIDFCRKASYLPCCDKKGGKRQWTN